MAGPLQPAESRTAAAPEQAAGKLERAVPPQQARSQRLAASQEAWPVQHPAEPAQELHSPQVQVLQYQPAQQLPCWYLVSARCSLARRPRQAPDRQPRGAEAGWGLGCT